MKKIVKLVALMTIAAALMVSCKKTTDTTDPNTGNQSSPSAPSNPESKDEAANAATNGVEKTNNENEDSGNAENTEPATAYLPITKEFDISAWNDYAEVAVIDLSKVNAPATWATVAVVAEVYDADGKAIDLASTWSSRLAIGLVTDLNGPFYDGSKNPYATGSTDYNGGVSDKKLAYKEDAVGILVQVKTDKVSKVIVKEVIFE